MDWYNKGYLNKDNLRYLILTSPKQFHVSVMPEKLKSVIKEKYEIYTEFLETCTDTTINQATPCNKIQAILKEMQKNEVYNLKTFQDEYYKENFLNIFEEFNIR
jgi:predicted transcriptional regulator